MAKGQVVHEIVYGCVNVNVMQSQDDKYLVDVTRFEPTEEGYRSPLYFRAEDLPTAAKALLDAHTFIVERVRREQMEQKAVLPKAP